MTTTDLTQLAKDCESPETLAYEHALDVIYIITEEMHRQGISKKELAQRMGIPMSRLSKLMNTQTNMTLKTIAKFELALGIKITIGVEKSLIKEIRIKSKAARNNFIEFESLIKNNSRSGECVPKSHIAVSNENTAGMAA